MAKIIYVPEWLYNHLKEQGLSVQDLEKPISSTILSKVDVINYHRSQDEFFKLLHQAAEDGTVDWARRDEVMYHAIPSDIPELAMVVSARKQNEKSVCWNTLLSSVDSPSAASFYFEMCQNGDDIIAIGMNNTSNNELTRRSDELYKCGGDKSAPILWNVLGLCHSCLRAVGGTDKSAVLRENPYVSQLYVKSIMLAS